MRTATDAHISALFDLVKKAVDLILLGLLQPILADYQIRFQPFIVKNSSYCLRIFLFIKQS